MYRRLAISIVLAICLIVIILTLLRSTIEESSPQSHAPPGRLSTKSAPLGGFDSVGGLQLENTPARNEAVASEPGTSHSPGQQEHTWEESAPHLREMASSMTEDDTRDFVVHALQWPPGEADEDNTRMPDFMSKALNPQGKEILAIDRDQLLVLLAESDRLIESQAQVTAAFCADALKSYFDQARYERAPPGDNLPASALRQGGRYTRNSTITWWGWTVRTRFSTADYPQVEAEFEILDSLKAERREAIVAFIRAL